MDAEEALLQLTGLCCHLMYSVYPDYSQGYIYTDTEARKETCPDPLLTELNSQHIADKSCVALIISHYKHSTALFLIWWLFYHILEKSANNTSMKNSGSILFKLLRKKQNLYKHQWSQTWQWQRQCRSWWFVSSLSFHFFCVSHWGTPLAWPHHSSS